MGSGFTLAEVVLGGTVLAIAIAAILGAYVGQVTLNEHARNLSLAIQDANRVIEQVRQNTASAPCTVHVCPPGAGGCAGGNNWDTWLNANGGKSIDPNNPANERIVVTCQNNPTPPTLPSPCGDIDQVGTGEWALGKISGNTDYDPLRLTVAVCWRHRNRNIGECTWNGAALVPDDTLTMPNDTDNVINSPAMLTTLVTCRG